MFKAAKSHRISQNIVNQIRDAILGGSLKPGDRLPSEKDLAENFGVSKASLREAFRALEAIGLLEVKQGMSGGAFVCEVDLETARSNMFNYIFFQNPSIHEFTQLRGFIEGPVAEIAAQKITPADLADLEDNLANTEKQLDTGSFYYELDTYFHHRIATIAGNKIICFVIDSLKTALVNIKLELELDRQFAHNVYESHVRIVEALRQQDPQAARREMLNHIEKVEQEMVAHGNAHSPFMP